VGSEQRDGVFIGLPSYDGRVEFDSASNVLQAATRRPKVVMHTAGSLLARNFNILWCNALNNREKYGLRWFAMLHGDIIPHDPYWIDTLIAEAEQHGAGLMSAVVPIKDPSGYTSTALFGDDEWVPLCRLTQKQVNDDMFFQTFDADVARVSLRSAPDGMKTDVLDDAQLLVNTGCMVARLDAPWSEHVHFEINDRIVKLETGEWACQVMPEDWNLSLQVARLGGRVMATTKVKLAHRGNADYESTGTWGRDRDHLLDATV
jgi:hypothetical protein